MRITNHLHLAILAFIICVASSCAKPLISNVQNGTYNYKPTSDDVLTVSVGIRPLPSTTEEEEKPKTFFDLRDSLAHVYLKIMASKVAHPDSLVKYLSKPLWAAPPKPTAKKPVNYTTYKVRLSFANLKKYYNDAKYMHPNTRLEYLTTSLVIPATSPVTIYTIDRLENEFEEIDLGTLSRDQTVTMNAKLTGEAGSSATTTDNYSTKNTGTTNNQNAGKVSLVDDKGNVIGTFDNSSSAGSGRETNNGRTRTAQTGAKANAEIGYLNTESIKEAVAVKLKRMRTGFTFTERNLTIAQRGRPLGDISDNIYVTATLKVSSVNNVLPLTVYDFEKLFEEDGSPVKAEKLSFNSRLINFVPCDNAQNITLTTNYEGAIRVPGNETDKKSGHNALEYDDKVTFYKFGNKAGETLEIDKNEYCKNAYKIMATDGTDMYVLKIEAPLALELDVFGDDKPEMLLEWVRRQQVNPVAANLTTTKYKIFFENIRTRGRIHLVNTAFTATQLAAISSLQDINNTKRNP